MLSILMMIKTLFQLLPLVIDGIKVVESLFPASGQGAAKLELVKGMVSHAYTVGTDAEQTFEAVAPAVDLIAKSAVGIMNASGVFKTGSASTVAQINAGTLAFVPAPAVVQGDAPVYQSLG